MRRYVVIIIFVILFSSTINADTSWQLVYENDHKGNPVVGKIDNLAAAILAGADVKAITCSKFGLFNTYTLYKLQILHQNKEKPKIRAYTANFNSNDTHLSNEFFSSNYFYSYIIINTSGEVTKINLDWYINSIKKTELKQNVSIKWFIKY